MTPSDGDAVHGIFHSTDPSLPGVTPAGADGVPDRRSRILGTQSARRAIKAEHMAQRTQMERLADWLAGFAGSAGFFFLHVVWFAGWIAWNTGAFGFAAFDPFPFGLLTMVVSLEAIFLSIFVLMSQTRDAKVAELREEVTLQVNLRMEEEVTKTLQLVAGLYGRLNLQRGEDPDLEEMLRPLDPRRIEKDLIAQIAFARGRKAELEQR